MTLFAALNTAISGLSAQSAAFSNISDNVANSQTVGFKSTDTAFIDYLTGSTAEQNSPGAVVATPSYQNSVQGTLAQTNNPLNLAITGQGFFTVSKADGVANGVISFSPQPYYTRAGDFSLDKNGYLVNSGGDYLNGWNINSTTGAINRTTLSPIQLTQTQYNPVATSNVTLQANLPATPAANTPVAAQIDVYDALGTSHTITLDWTQTSAGVWNVAINAPDDINSAARGGATVSFGAVSGNAVPEGTVGSVSGGTGSVTAGTYTAGTPATLSFTADFGTGSQPITLNLGEYGTSAGLTQYAGTAFSLQGITQDGVPPGSFSSVTTSNTGDVQVNYNNGQARLIARVPVTTFNNPNALQRQDAQAFTTTVDSGTPAAHDAGSNGAGGLVVSSVEDSNVDIASQFSKLIVAQRAYSANSKIVTTADELLQQTLDMKR